MSTRKLFIRYLLLCVLLLTLSGDAFAQKQGSASLLKEKNRIRVDTVNINLKNIATQLVTLRDSLGVQIMALDKKIVNMQPKAKLNAEKVKSKLTIYKTELEKLIEEVTLADISYITEVKKRAYNTVLDVRADFIKTLAEINTVN